LFVVVPEKIQQKKSLPMTKRDMKDKRNFVIIGGGPAGLNCAETLRYSGYSGKITLVSNEKLLPYDRTLLSKTLPFGDASKFQLRDADWLKDADIDVV
jgi:NAD(P)H-nitrite reductase large subunit